MEAQVTGRVSLELLNKDECGERSVREHVAPIVSDAQKTTQQCTEENTSSHTHETRKAHKLWD